MKPELIEIAREAGFTIATGMNKGQWPCVDGVDIEDELTKFAELLGKKRLNELQRQEPVAHVYAIERTGRPLVAWDDAKGIGLGDKLYAAPKALAPEPLTDDELWKFWWSRPEVPEGEDESMEAQFVAAARSILAAHGITKGTP